MWDLIRSIPYLTLFIVVGIFVGLGYAVRFFVLALLANPDRLGKKLKQVEKRIEHGKYIKALEILDRVLQDIGYNYRSPRPKKRALIHRNIDYNDLQPALFKLTEILAILGRQGNNLKIYEDMLSFISELDDVLVGKGVKCAHNAKVYAQMAQHYFNDRDYRASITFESMGQVEDLKGLRLLGKSEEVKAKRPLKSTELTEKGLKELDLAQYQKDYETELNACLPEKVEETSTSMVQSRIFDFLKNVALYKSRPAAQRTPTAGDLVSNILARNLAAEANKKKEEEKPPEEKKDVILL